MTHTDILLLETQVRDEEENFRKHLSTCTDQNLDVGISMLRIRQHLNMKALLRNDKPDVWKDLDRYRRTLGAMQTWTVFEIQEFLSEIPNIAGTGKTIIPKKAA